MDCTAFIALFLLFVSAAAAAAEETLSAYEVLQQFDFPIGLLPKGATGYELNNSTGDFKAYLGEGTCSFSLEGSYDLKYKSTIKGKISKDKLTKLSGVRVKVLLFWFDIVEVRRRGEELEFSVGILSASFGMENFLECPQCGCGLNCVNNHQGRRNVKLNRFVASS
ncbi:hypothetical protein RHGRI_003070 [Rhododendron griersonianum]|uniref:DUF538 family protein n=1 Tax=Rhododendron griersonianum TaxID=479676 RepID=A0AAV6LRG5_9ERIC|nr:hypothetical protein RHGRI_003070 [Rhododendron griersonianum]